MDTMTLSRGEHPSWDSVSPFFQKEGRAKDYLSRQKHSFCFFGNSKMGIIQSSQWVNDASSLSYFFSTPDSLLCTQLRLQNLQFPLARLSLSRRPVGGTRGKIEGRMKEERQAHAISLLFFNIFLPIAFFPGSSRNSPLRAQDKSNSLPSRLDLSSVAPPPRAWITHSNTFLFSPSPTGVTASCS